MQELDKKALGERIRQIRLGAGLRQRELAERLGTTQSAVHKYEHGVVPEPRRLIEIARVGRTSVEWVLTGTHWENGSREQRRLDADLLATAALLRDVPGDQRAPLDEALRIVRAATQAWRESNDASSELSSETEAILEGARRIQRAVLLTIAEETRRRLGG